MDIQAQGLCYAHGRERMSCASREIITHKHTRVHVGSEMFVAPVYQKGFELCVCAKVRRRVSGLCERAVDLRPRALETWSQKVKEKRGEYSVGGGARLEKHGYRMWRE